MLRSTIAAAVVLSVFAGSEAIATPQAERSCRSTVGARLAKRYVKDCEEVAYFSVHPRCNVDNPCSTIFDEIVGSCGMIRDLQDNRPELGWRVPPLCKNYPPASRH